MKPQEISPGYLRRGGTHDPIRVDISTTCHLGHGGEFVGVESMIRENFLPCLVFRKTKSLSPIVGALSTMPVKKSGLGLLNPVMSAKEKYISYQRGSAKLIWAVTGEGELSNADHLLALEG